MPSAMKPGHDLQSKSHRRKSCLVFALFWSFIAPLSLILDFQFWNRTFDERSWLLILFCTIASFLTAIVAWILERSITRSKPATTRFTAIFILLMIGTSGATYLGSALYTFQYFIPELDGWFSLEGMEQIIFFFLTHGYSFAASTMRLFLPMGLISLFAAGILYCILSPTIVNGD